MVYVDPAIFKKSDTGRKSYCHLVADSLDELHQFAIKIGIKRHFFHNTVNTPHYDLTAEQRSIAIIQGACEIDTKKLVGIAKAAKLASSTKRICTDS